MPHGLSDVYALWSPLWESEDSLHTVSLQSDWAFTMAQNGLLLLMLIQAFTKASEGKK